MAEGEKADRGSKSRLAFPGDIEGGRDFLSGKPDKGGKEEHIVRRGEKRKEVEEGTARNVEGNECIAFILAEQVDLNSKQ